MRRPVYLTRIAVVVAGGLVLTGCGGGKPGAGQVTEAGREELADISDLYQNYAKDKGRPPATAADLKPYAAGSPLGGRPLNDPSFVVLYGTPIGGSSVLAYHKDVPSQGGLVLLGDGTFKTMTAAEFQAAPKAGK